MSYLPRFRFGPPDLEDGTVRREREDRIIPWIASPFPKTTPNQKGHHVVGEEQKTPRDSAYVEGFVDLTFAAALSSFNEEHAIGTGEELGGYAAFFIIIWWTWASQVFYDARYEVMDLFSRTLKFCQFGIFMFWASYGNNFDVAFGLREDNEDLENLISEGLTQPEASSFVSDDDAATIKAWKVFTLAYVISRGILLIEYAHMMIQARRARRFGQASLVPTIGTIISLVLWGIAYAFSNSSTRSAAIVRIALCYSGIAIEIAGTFLETMFSGFRPYNKTNLGERFGLLTLMIIGEGIISLTKSTRNIVQAYGFETRTYAQIFCSLFIVYLIFHIYFDRGDVEIGRKRSQTWAWLHFPTQFMIILIFAGTNGVLSWGNLATAQKDLLPRINSAYHQIQELKYNIHTPEAESLTKDLRTIDIVWPAYANDLQDEYRWYRDLLDRGNASKEELQAAFNDYIFDLTDLHVQVATNLFQVYGIDPTGESLVKYNQLTYNTTVAQDRHFVVLDQYIDLMYENGLAPGLYISPVAGGFLICTMLLSLTVKWPGDRYAWIATFSRFLMGTILCLLGFFGLGDHRVIREKWSLLAYTWISSKWLLPTIVFAYATDAILQYVLLLLARRAYRRLDHDSLPLENRVYTTLKLSDDEKENGESYTDGQKLYDPHKV